MKIKKLILVAVSTLLLASCAKVHMHIETSSDLVNSTSSLNSSSSVNTTTKDSSSSTKGETSSNQSEINSELSDVNSQLSETSSDSSSIDYPVVTGSIEITKSIGYQEGAYVTFNKLEGATSYNVYYKKIGDSNDYTKIDGMLIRDYSSYVRADILGLTKGDYSIKVTANNSEGEISESASSSNVSVISHVREGYAFVNNKVPGAYNLDGSLKSGAVILYVTDTTKDTIQLEVTTSKKGATSIGTGLGEILYYFKKGYDTRPLDIRFIGNVNTSDLLTGESTLKGKGDVLLDSLTNGVTLEGVGDDATCNGFGIRVKGSQLVEIRNLGLMNCSSDEGDSVGFQQENDYVWVHNCDVFYGNAGSDADQAKGDGALDVKDTDHVTISYNHFYDTGKTHLLGMNNDGEINMFATYHHNWYDHSDSRHPRVRDYTTHVYNNYYDGVAKYGIGAAGKKGPSIFSEANYFRGTSKPMLISLQGTDILADPDGSGTFSKESGGIIKSYNNKMVGDGQTIKYAPYSSTNTVEFDAYEATTRDEQVPSTVKTKSGSFTYSNFDTASDFYTYAVESPDDAKTSVTKYAGRVEGGDFKWTFTNADDTSYNVNTALKTALTNYKTSVSFIGLGDTNNIVINGTGGQVVNSVTSVSLSSISASLKVNETLQLTATVEITGNASTSVAYSSSDETTATVSSLGLVTALKAGEVTIKATSTFDDTKYATCVINITEDTTKVTLESVSMQDTSVAVNDTLDLTSLVTLTPSSILASNCQFTFTSSDTEVASIEDNTLTAIKEGTTTITVSATYDGKTVTSTCTVTVTNSSTPVFETLDYNFETKTGTLIGVTDTGSDTSSKNYGSITYNGVTYTKGRKFDSKASFTFTISSKMSCTLVGKKKTSSTKLIDFKINDTNYRDEDDDEIITTTLDAGTYTITRGENGEAGLYYIYLASVTE